MLKLRRALALLLTAVLLTLPLGLAEEAAEEVVVEVEEVATSEPTEEPTEETTEETTAEPTEEPMLEPTEEPVVEEVPAATAEPEVEEIPEATEEPEAEVLPEEELPEEEEELVMEEAPIETQASSGKIGNLTWKLEKGTLTISGSGAMPDYEYPWEDEKDDITSVVIKSGVTRIGNYVFLECDSITSVSIPSSVTSIGEGAFSDCKSLTSVTIPSGVTSIGQYAFCECKSLTSISIPSKVTTISQGVFSGCESLKSVTIPSGVTKIGNYAFSSCESLTKVTIPSKVTVIGDGVFSGCMELTSVTIPSGVTKIGEYAFSYCEALTKLTIPSGVTKIGEGAFQGCRGLTSVTIPSGVTVINDYTFWECESLTSVTIPGKVTKIGKAAFVSCYSLTKVSIPGSVTSIGTEAFLGCDSLKSVTIPSSVTSIGKYAFQGCGDLTSVTILGKDCQIYNQKETLGYSDTTTIYGLSGSTAKTYADKYGYKFVATTGSSGTSLAAPKLTSVTNTATGVKIVWGKVTGAAKYRVYYREGASGSFAKLINTSAGSYTWTGAKSGTKYNFTVRCLDSNGNVASSYDSTGLTITYVAAPKLTSVTNAATGVKIAWGKVTGAARYRVYYREGTSGTFKKLVNTSAGSYTWPDAKSGATYNFTVRCLNSSNEVVSAYDSTGLTITYVAAPKLTGVTKVSGGIKIAWDKVTGAERYRVYYREGTSGTFKKLINTSAGSYTWPDAKSGTTYNFTVRALNSKNEVISAYDSKGLTIAYK